VHETTLTFLPKLLAIGLLLAISAGWLVEEATTYAQGSFGRIATVNQ
jgi:flagellar biosynthesis protein FliQ